MWWRKKSGYLWLKEKFVKFSHVRRSRIDGITFSTLSFEVGALLCDPNHSVTFLQRTPDKSSLEKRHFQFSSSEALVFCNSLSSVNCHLNSTLTPLGGASLPIDGAKAGHVLFHIILGLVFHVFVYLQIFWMLTHLQLFGQNCVRQLELEASNVKTAAFNAGASKRSLTGSIL